MFEWLDLDNKYRLIAVFVGLALLMACGSATEWDFSSITWDFYDEFNNSDWVNPTPDANGTTWVEQAAADQDVDENGGYVYTENLGTSGVDTPNINIEDVVGTSIVNTTLNYRYRREANLNDNELSRFMFNYDSCPRPFIYQNSSHVWVTAGAVTNTSAFAAGTDFHNYTVVYDNTNEMLWLYVDANTTESLSVDYSALANTAVGRIIFGTGLKTDTGNITIDYVRIATEGWIPAVAGPTPTITLSAPTDGDDIYWLNRSQMFNFTPVWYEAIDAFSNCSLYVNSTYRASNTTDITNNTLATIDLNLTVTDWGYNTWYVNCTNGTDNTLSSTYNFTFVQPFTCGSLTNTNVYESADTEYGGTATVNTTDGWSWSTTAMYWNSTLIAGALSTNATHRYRMFENPLVETNNTAINVAMLVYANASDAPSAQECWTNGSVNVFHSYYWGDYYPDTAVLPGSTINIYSNITNVSSQATLALWATFNNTNYTLSGTSNPYSTTATAPVVTGTSESFVSNSTLNVTFDSDDYGASRTYYRVSENETIVVSNVFLVECPSALTNTSSVNFTFLDEVNQSRINSDMEITFTIATTADLTVNSTANATITNTNNVSFCIFPVDAEIYVNSFQIYHDNAGNYRYRNYFMNNATLTNVSQNINLYNIETADSDLLTLTIVDDLVAQEGDYVTMERYYPGEDLYRAVEIGLTDEDGQTFLYPVPNDVYYRFIVVRDYETVYSGTPREIGVSSFTIDTGEGLTLEYFDYESISVACNRTGDIIGCSIVNPNGESVGVALLVREIGIYADTEICYTEISSVSTTTIQCNVSGYTGIIQADLMWIAPDSLLAVWSELFGATATNTFGDLGLFVGVLLILGSALLMAFSPALSIVGALLGLAISVILGIVALSVTSVLLIIIAGAFIIVKVKT